MKWDDIDPEVIAFIREPIIEDLEIDEVPLPKDMLRRRLEAAGPPARRSGKAQPFSGGWGFWSRLKAVLANRFEKAQPFATRSDPSFACYRDDEYPPFTRAGRLSPRHAAGLVITALVLVACSIWLSKRTFDKAAPALSASGKRGTAKGGPPADSRHRTGGGIDSPEAQLAQEPKRAVKAAPSLAASGNEDTSEGRPTPDSTPHPGGPIESAGGQLAQVPKGASLPGKSSGGNAGTLVLDPSGAAPQMAEREKEETPRERADNDDPGRDKKLFVVIATDDLALRDGPDVAAIGPAMAVNSKLVSKMIERNVPPRNYVRVKVEPRSMSGPVVLNVIASLDTRPDDAILFFGSGHGFYNLATKETYLTMSKDSHGVSVGQIESAIKAKHVHFAAVIVDCCNQLEGKSPPGLQGISAGRRVLPAAPPQRVISAVLQRRFFEPSGSVVIVSSPTNEAYRAIWNDPRGVSVRRIESAVNAKTVRFAAVVVDANIPPPAAAPQGISRLFQRLFFESVGTVVIESSALDEYAIIVPPQRGLAFGSLFTRSFDGVMYSPADDDPDVPDWLQICQQAQEEVDDLFSQIAPNGLVTQLGSGKQKTQKSQTIRFWRNGRLIQPPEHTLDRPG